MNAARGLRDDDVENMRKKDFPVSSAGMNLILTVLREQHSAEHLSILNSADTKQLFNLTASDASEHPKLNFSKQSTVYVLLLNAVYADLTLSYNWSVLIVIPDLFAFHYDFAAPDNTHVAQQAVTALGVYLDRTMPVVQQVDVPNRFYYEGTEEDLGADAFCVQWVLERKLEHLKSIGDIKDFNPAVVDFDVSARAARSNMMDLLERARPKDYLTQIGYLNGERREWYQGIY